MTDEEKSFLQSVFMTAFCSSIIAVLFVIALKFTNSIAITLLKNDVLAPVIVLFSYSALFFIYTLILKATLFNGKESGVEYKATLFFTALFISAILLSSAVMDMKDFKRLVPYSVSLLHVIFLSHI